MKYSFFLFLFLLTKLSYSQYDIYWTKCYGGSQWDTAYQSIETYDGGLIIAGATFSTDGDVTANHGLWNAWLIKTDMMGNIEWQKTYGGSGLDEFNSIVQTPDSGFVIIGTSASNDFDVTGNHGWSDVWLVKVDHTGNLLWEYSYGGTSFDMGRQIIPTLDGGFILLSNTSSNDGNVTGNNGGNDI